jgi:hypothetical protein
MSVVRSGSFLVAALAFTVLTGCDSTQQQAVRARLKAERFIASAAPTRVRRRNPDIRVVAVKLVRGSAGSAITVRLRNAAARPWHDLPISVGILGSLGHRSYLNASPNTYYFKTHLASIAARGSVTWVFTTDQQLPFGAKPFALVGARSSVPATLEHTLPQIDVATASSPSGAKGTRRLLVKVTNTSAVPQYQLQIYALGLDRGRYVAAGGATLAHLGTETSETVAVSMIGAQSPPSIELEALPTMFQ